jgi:hypothetical protein
MSPNPPIISDMVSPVGKFQVTGVDTSHEQEIAA